MRTQDLHACTYEGKTVLVKTYTLLPKCENILRCRRTFSHNLHLHEDKRRLMNVHKADECTETSKSIYIPFRVPERSFRAIDSTKTHILIYLCE